jgi:hypothetical protein
MKARLRSFWLLTLRSRSFTKHPNNGLRRTIRDLCIVLIDHVQDNARPASAEDSFLRFIPFALPFFFLLQSYNTIKYLF